MRRVLNLSDEAINTKPEVQPTLLLAVILENWVAQILAKLKSGLSQSNKN